MKDFFRWLYGRQAPADETVWHKWELFIPRWIDGRLCTDVWRRKTAEGWAYASREETDEEFWTRQW